MTIFDNDFPCEIKYLGLTFSCVTSAYFSMRIADASCRDVFCDLTAAQARILGSQIRVRPDWDTIKNDILYDIMFEKFRQHPELRSALMAENDDSLRFDPCGLFLHKIRNFWKENGKNEQKLYEANAN